MPIIQINVFICEICQDSTVEKRTVALYEEPVVEPPEGWTYNDEDKLVCPKH